MFIRHHLSLAQLTNENLSTLKAIGVNYIAIMHPPPPRADEDNTDMWRDACRKVDSHGMKLYKV